MIRACRWQLNGHSGLTSQAPSITHGSFHGQQSGCIRFASAFHQRTRRDSTLDITQIANCTSTSQQNTGTGAVAPVPVRCHPEVVSFELLDSRYFYYRHRPFFLASARRSRPPQNAARGLLCPSPPATSSGLSVRGQGFRGRSSGSDGLWPKQISLTPDLSSLTPLLTTSHTVATVVAKVAIAATHGDRAAVVAAGSVGLEAGELLLAVVASRVVGFH